MNTFVTWNERTLAPTVANKWVYVGNIGSFVIVFIGKS